MEPTILEQPLRHYAICPIGPDQDLRAGAGSVRDDFDPFWQLTEFNRLFVFVYLGPRPTGLLNQDMVESVPHHHVRSRPRGFDEERLLAVIGELDAGDGMLDDVFDIRIQQLVDPDGKPPAAYLVPWMRLLLQAESVHGN